MLKRDYDFEIVYAIKQGHHHVNEIYNQVYRFNKSKFKFSNHIDMLVKAGLIKKTTKDKRPYFSVGKIDEDKSLDFGILGKGVDLGTFEDFKEIIDSIKKETVNLEKKTKKYSDKKLLQESKDDIVAYLNQLSYAVFRGLVAKHKIEQIQMHEWEKELRQLIKTKIQLLEKRDDPKLVKLCHGFVGLELVG